MTDGVLKTDEKAPPAAPRGRVGDGTPGPGRPPGTPNKATTAAREAIGKFVDGNAHRLQHWLDMVAEGVPDPGDITKMIVKPDPEKAFQLFQSVVEYHVPKLARTEVTGDGGGPVIVQSTPMDSNL
jgi:hypothetical protein